MKFFQKSKSYLLFVFIGFLFAACGGNEPKQSAGTQQPTKVVPNYHEQHRPQFHYSPPTKWTNDPNGMVYFDGEYHLFYQHYPDSTVWGPMHWGHAVSKDLVHWENLPIALYPDSLGYIFSGSAVVDWKNTTGFGKDGQPPLVAMFTYHYMPGEKAGKSDYQSQAIAYSTDRGRTWTKYEGNPVIPNPGNVKDIRDPKVIWDDARNQWVVALAVGQHIEFWNSKDMKSWSKLSEFGDGLGAHGGVWECPDLFPITVEGTKEKMWVLIVNLNPGQPNGGSGTQYFIGKFDGKNFNLDPGFAKKVQGGNAVWLDGGKDNYAGVTWSDAPDGRRLFLGWMSNWEYSQAVPTVLWRNAMTIPWSLSLHKTQGEYHLFGEPVQELQALRGTHVDLSKSNIRGGLDLTGQLDISTTLSEIELEFAKPDDYKGSFGVMVSNKKGESYRIGYNATTNQFFSDRLKAGDSSFSAEFAKQQSTINRFSNAKTVKLHVFLDVASAELFADNGANMMTETFFPSEDYTQLKIFSDGGNPELLEGKIYQLMGIWK
ncbi:MAG: glycoside hydrolase family 32 protein [Bacteroidetes bacterium]|nr:glycoside hydrolase family 32 protein [Bacteroidota bacterium]